VPAYFTTWTKWQAHADVITIAHETVLCRGVDLPLHSVQRVIIASFVND
jgi:hypothetical protein